jgi:hypothetical protein
MALKSLLRESTNTITETVKQIMNGPSVAELEAQWVLAQEDVDRALAAYDETPDEAHYTALQSARAALKALEDPLASARRREIKKNENMRTAANRKSQEACEADIARFRTHAVDVIEPMLKNIETMIATFIDHRNAVLASAAVAGNALALNHAQNAANVLTFFMTRTLHPLTGLKRSDDPTQGRFFSSYLPDVKEGKL